MEVADMDTAIKRNSFVPNLRKVLVIDDEEILRDILSDVLELMEFDAVLANSGQEGIEALEKNNGEFDLVLLDMMMPGMNGIETYKKITTLYPGMKIILMSGFPERDIILSIKLMNHDHFILKPFSLDEIKKTIQKMFSYNHQN